VFISIRNERQKFSRKTYMTVVEG